MQFSEDLVVIHDPQPAALIRSRDTSAAHWVWRCHIDLSNPIPRFGNFCGPLSSSTTRPFFHLNRSPVSCQFRNTCFIPASIRSRKRIRSSTEFRFVQKVCDDFGIDRSRPIVTQVSRFDRLKDPVGVVQAYKLAKKYVDCQLVLAGGGASDDPEGAAVLQEVKEAAGDDPDIIILDLPPWCALEINALQRASTLIVQKSIKEGFGLTVTEALWKGKPTIAGAVGGIPNQIIHKLTGVLVHSVEGCAYPDSLPAHPSGIRHSNWAKTAASTSRKIS